jgi:methionyl-tRNA formyltransferase
MKKITSLRIVFMGTPAFAVASLHALVEAGASIVGVVTAPDKPAGRGMQLQQSAVKKYALEQGLHLLQPEKLKDPVFLSSLQMLQADIQVVVAFRMLPVVVWNMPPMGTINVHASLLPQYRGAAPINWAVIQGETTTGLTTFKLQHEIDTGDILLQQQISIHENETAGALHDKMKEAGAALLVQTIEGLASNTLKATPQSFLPATASTMLHAAPKISTTTCTINFAQPVKAVHNLVRGLSPFPGAFTFLTEKMFKIYSSDIEYETKDNASLPTPGKYFTDGKTYLKFSCADGYLHCKEVQLEGKKAMPIEAFLRGFRT